MKIGFSRDVRNLDVRFSGYEPEEIPVVMAKGSHLFPYRTQKLSLSAPMVLGWRRPGRVGHCRIPNEKAQQMLGFFFFAYSEENAQKQAQCRNNQPKCWNERIDSGLNTGVNCTSVTFAVSSMGCCPTWQDRQTITTRRKQICSLKQDD